MAYGTNTITSATGPADLRTALEALMITQGNWDLVDSYTSGTYNVRMWKSRAAGNSWNKDFYLAMMTNTSAATNLYFKVFEDYNVAAKLAYRGVPGAVASIDPVTYSAYGATGYAPESSQWTAANNLSALTTQYTYRARVTGEGLFMAVTTSGNPVFYCGLFQPLWPHPGEFPLCILQPGNNGSFLGITRRPGASAASTTTWNLTAAFTTMFDPLVGVLGTADGLRQGKTYASRLPVIHASTATAQSELWRGYLGLDYVTMKVDPVVQPGDTVTIGGNQYVCTLVQTSYGLFSRTD